MTSYEEPTIDLADGHRIPVLGLGVWQVPNGRKCVNAVRWALDLGYRHIDTAQAYGNEESVGRALRDSGVPREEVFITTKFYPGGERPGGRDRSEASSASASTTSTSTSSTGHKAVRRGRGPVWSARASAATRGRSVCRTSASTQLDEVLAVAGIAPVVNQVQFSPFEYRRRLFEACARRGVVTEAYSPLGTGRHLATERSAEVASRVGRTPAQVLLRWCVQHGLVVLPKSIHRDRIAENARIFDFALSDGRHGCARRARPHRRHRPRSRRQVVVTRRADPGATPRSLRSSPVCWPLVPTVEERPSRLHPTPAAVPVCSDPSQGGSRSMRRAGPATGRPLTGDPRTSSRCRCCGSRVRA